MRNRRPMGVAVRVIFFFIIAALLYFFVYCPLSRINGVLG